MIVKIEAEVRPTESKDKVVKALRNLFSITSLKESKEGNYIRLIASSRGAELLNKFHSLLRRQRILDAARQYLSRGKREGGVTFYLNKQVAYIGKISFCSFEYGESPLGAIVVEIKTENPDMLIDWLAPPTSEGVPIERVKFPPEDP